MEVLVKPLQYHQQWRDGLKSTTLVNTANDGNDRDLEIITIKSVTEGSVFTGQCCILLACETLGRVFYPEER